MFELRFDFEASGAYYLDTQGNYVASCSEAEYIEAFQALKENTSMKHIRLWLHDCTERYAEAAAEYVESSTTLQTMELLLYDRQYYQENPVITSSLLLRALSRNTSVSELIIHTDVGKLAIAAFQELLTCTQTLQKLQIISAWWRSTLWGVGRLGSFYRN
jgi:hypothetical protein